MRVKNSKFISSETILHKLPPPERPEISFIGRSNVGKSSLINMLCEKKGLAKTSSTPGKTQTINHFLINENYYWVDLPGYGYADVPLSVREGFRKMIENYLLKRENLINLFVLIDSRHKPQKIDLEFLTWCGIHEIPFSIIFTKADKMKSQQLINNIDHYKSVLLETWVELPPIFISSSEKKIGQTEILDYIFEIQKLFVNHAS